MGAEQDIKVLLSRALDGNDPGPVGDPRIVEALDGIRRLLTGSFSEAPGVPEFDPGIRGQQPTDGQGAEKMDGSVPREKDPFAG